MEDLLYFGKYNYIDNKVILYTVDLFYFGKNNNIDNKLLLNFVWCDLLHQVKYKTRLEIIINESLHFDQLFFPYHVTKIVLTCFG